MHDQRIVHSNAAMRTGTLLMAGCYEGRQKSQTMEATTMGANWRRFWLSVLAGFAATMCILTGALHQADAATSYRYVALNLPANAIPRSINDRGQIIGSLYFDNSYNLEQNSFLYTIATSTFVPIPPRRLVWIYGGDKYQQRRFHCYIASFERRSCKLLTIINLQC
jgi:hypothetical protein